MTKQEEIASFLATHITLPRRASSYGWWADEYPWPSHPNIHSQRPTVERVAEELLGLAEFRALQLGTWLGTTDGRIVTALSPWLWLVGLGVVGALLFAHFNFLLLLILIMSLPRLFSLFRRRTPEEARYFEVTPEQRWTMAALYFGLVAFLVLAMHLTYVKP